MAKLPTEIRLTIHARERLEERNKIQHCYNTKNLMKSSCKWYGKDDLIPESPLYIHCLYVCRKAKQKFGYITDGNIEVLYDKSAHVAITIMEVKDKFKPITQYIKPEYLKQIEIKKENRKMKGKIGNCLDCGRKNLEVMPSGVYAGLCASCKMRKQNAKSRGREYIPYLKMSDVQRQRVDNMMKGQARRKAQEKEIVVPKIAETVSVVENYYQVKAEQNPAIAQITEKPIIKKQLDPLSDVESFVTILRSCGSEIPEQNLRDVLNVLVATDKLKEVFMTIAENDNQQAMLDLEQALNVVERKLQHDWEYGGFQEADDIKFKGFLTWRRVLKGAIFFWKKLYQTNALIEIQRAWNAYTQDPTDKILLAGDRIDSTMKRYQITTESISTILNTKRPFTRVFYATSKEEAYESFVKWMADRQLHENKSKTVITELKGDGSSDGRKED